MRVAAGILLVCAAYAAAGAIPRSKPASAQEPEAPEGQWSVHPQVDVIDKCRFNSFVCEPGATDEWTSCCEDPSCPEQCDGGTLRPNTQLLYWGNSHMGEIVQATLCRNVHHLTSITFAPFLGHNSNAQLMLGLPPPPMTTWTYDAAAGELRDENGAVVPRWIPNDEGALRNGRPPDAIVAYTFANGARLFSLSNTPLQLTAGAAYDPAENPFSMEDIAQYVGFKWPDLTAVLVNKGNFRFWAWKLWCGNGFLAKILREREAAGAPLQNVACPALKDAARDRATFTDLDNFMTRLGAAGFRGRAVVVRQLMMDEQGAAPPPPLDVAAVGARAPFALRFFDWAYLMNGRLCAVHDCGARVDHMCLPGPPDDIARVALRYLYGDV
eukprot:TRINITY_DN1722_c0_g1_i1.p2 TRINITY_DN1722_c0_g1~~TRINITY_DN1722_c0_g1_i1.p2  ORF type:complete len:383 (-),score=166.87 TRINITY_DN1722_c0_g1_i1:829-1977(-)